MERIEATGQLGVRDHRLAPPWPLRDQYDEKDQQPLSRSTYQYRPCLILSRIRSCCATRADAAFSAPGIYSAFTMAIKATCDAERYKSSSAGDVFIK